jgi:hypothetical protein
VSDWRFGRSSIESFDVSRKGFGNKGNTKSGGVVGIHDESLSTAIKHSVRGFFVSTAMFDVDRKDEVLFSVVGCIVEGRNEEW